MLRTSDVNRNASRNGNKFSRHVSDGSENQDGIGIAFSANHEILLEVNATGTLNKEMSENRSRSENLMKTILTGKLSISSW